MTQVLRSAPFYPPNYNHLNVHAQSRFRASGGLWSQPRRSLCLVSRLPLSVVSCSLSLLSVRSSRCRLSVVRSSRQRPSSKVKGASQSTADQRTRRGRVSNGDRRTLAHCDSGSIDYARSGRGTNRRRSTVATTSRAPSRLPAAGVTAMQNRSIQPQFTYERRCATH